MKRLYFIYLSVIVLFAACEEHENKPSKTDGIQPNPVGDITVENLPGGAKLTYSLPTDNDVLYVMAELMLKNGNTKSIKSSVYNNSLEIYGLGDTDEYTVNVYAIDRGENKSVAKQITIKPLTPPVQAIGNSAVLVAAFGGMNISWENPTEAEVAAIVMSQDTAGNMVQVGIQYSNQLKESYTVRGFNTDEREFKVIFRDRWDNFSDTLKTTLKPIFEEQLDRDLMSGVDLPHDAPAAWGWVKSYLFDGSYGEPGYHTPQGWKDDDPLPEYGDLNPHILTVDLGVEAKLSRFKIYQRPNDWIYYHGNPRFFDIWLAKTINNDGTFDGWVKVIENGEVIKPSGLPKGQYSNEDAEAAAAGNEFEIPISAESARYVRFVNRESWSGTTYMHFCELEFWGKVIN